MRLGTWEALEEVGRGGAGVVWRGRGPGGQDVAIKLLQRASLATVARFERERLLQATLGELQGFVPLLDRGESEHGPYLVMPFLRGGTLRDRLHRAGTLALAEALQLGIDLASAMALAHAQGIVHRDLKPENVLYTADGRPLVADLGIAKHHQPEAGVPVLSGSRETRGTLGYMAPEQMLDAREAGPAADVFALGAIIYECLAGRGPFDGPGGMVETLRRIQRNEATPLRELCPAAPAWLARTIASALAADPAARPKDAAALLRGLRPAPRSSRRGVAFIALALATLAAVAAIAPRPPAAPIPPPPPAPAPQPEPAPVASPLPAIELPRHDPLANPGFERELAPWRPDAFELHKARFAAVEEPPGSGAWSGRVECAQETDARLVQTVAVEPLSLYRFSARARTQGVATDKVGANVSVVGLFEHSRDLRGDQPWTDLSLLIWSGEQTKLDLACRLGFWWNSTTGRAWFERAAFEPVPLVRLTGPAELAHLPPETRVRLQGKRVALTLQARTLALLARPWDWLDRLDRFALELSRFRTRERLRTGAWVEIVETPERPDDLAGQVVRWRTTDLEPLLRSVEGGDWGVTALQSIAVEYLPAGWYWSPGVAAQLLLVFGVEASQARITAWGRVCDHADPEGHRLRDGYRSAAQLPGRDDLRHAYELLELQAAVGWPAVQSALRALDAIPEPEHPKGAEAWLRAFARELSRASQVDAERWLETRGLLPPR